MKFKSFWRLLGALALLFLSTNSVFACKCASGTQEDYFNQAEYVAFISVTATELRPAEELSQNTQEMLKRWGTHSHYIRVSFDEHEVFKGKGSTPAYLMEWISVGGNCALGLKPGWSYVVFLRKDLMGFVKDCTGTRSHFKEADENGEDVKLKVLRDLAEKQ